MATGLPVHIAAKLLGHQSLATTQAYVAVYDQDVIDHQWAFIVRRRGLRPSEEFQPAQGRCSATRYPAFPRRATRSIMLLQ